MTDVLVKDMEGNWDAYCPDQVGTPTHVAYTDFNPPEGFTSVGTVHIHPNGIGAFWSSEDLRTQRARLGTYMVFGTLDGVVQNWKCTRFTQLGHNDLEITDIVADFDLSKEYKPVKDWVDTIQRQAYVDPTHWMRDSNTALQDKLSIPDTVGISRTAIPSGFRKFIDFDTFLDTPVDMHEIRMELNDIIGFIGKDAFAKEAMSVLNDPKYTLVDMEDKEDIVDKVGRASDCHNLMLIDLDDPTIIEDNLDIPERFMS